MFFFFFSPSFLSFKNSFETVFVFHRLKDWACFLVQSLSQHGLLKRQFLLYQKRYLLTKYMFNWVSWCALFLFSVKTLKNIQHLIIHHSNRIIVILLLLLSLLLSILAIVDRVRREREKLTASNFLVSKPAKWLTKLYFMIFLKKLVYVNISAILPHICVNNKYSCLSFPFIMAYNIWEMLLTQSYILTV